MFLCMRRIYTTVYRESFRMNSYVSRKCYKFSANPRCVESAIGLRAEYSTKTSSVKENVKETSAASSLTLPVSQMKSKNDEFLPSAAHRIYAVIENEKKKNVVGAKSLPREECLKVLELLVRYKIPEEDLETILSKVPTLLAFPYSVWEETLMQLLKNYQFNPVQVLPLLADVPSILEGFMWKSLYDVLALLRGWGIREGKMQAAVLKNPEMLYRSTRSIQLNYTKLCEVFTKAKVLSLILSNPNVLTDEWETTQAKINYVHENMGVTVSAILKSSLFKHSLDHIITRHEFLERAGLYCKPDKHGTSKTENASLRNITDTSDEAFAKLVAGLTKEEYVVFEIIKRQELQRKDELTNSDTDYYSE